jgi:predicted nuclease of restriction endonuclease-like (RecB) superfamily
METNKDHSIEQEKPMFVARATTIVDADYQSWLKELKLRYRQSRIRASVKVNDELLKFYWSLGRDIAALHAESKYGSTFFDTLSQDLRREFPEQKGFSAANLRYMKRWYSFYYQDNTILQQAVEEFGHQLGEELEMPANFALVPWGHHIEIFTHSASVEEALYYVNKVATDNWSRSYLQDMMKRQLYQHEGKAVNNFDAHLPAPQSQLAKEILHDPYHFDFLSMTEAYQEKDLEDALAKNISAFLMELGSGFAYMGRQKELRMPGGKSFFPDMLFYHTRLKCYVVVELKAVEFEPEFAGKLNFYVSAADELLKDEHDNPSIGLLICKSKDNTVVEWSFRGMNAPVGVAAYEMQKIADETIRKQLPTEEEIQKALESADDWMFGGQGS